MANELFRNSYHASSSLNAPGTENGGVNVSLVGQRTEFQIIPIKVTSPNTKYEFSVLGKVTNDRIVGFFITSDEVKENEIMCDVNHGKIELTIDNTEILPSGTDSSLFTQKISSGFYDNIYDSFNEKATSSQIKGSYTSGPAATCPPEGYTVNLYFVETAKSKI